jgi:hypothetical protein
MKNKEIDARCDGLKIICGGLTFRQKMKTPLLPIGLVDFPCISGSNMVARPSFPN